MDVRITRVPPLLVTDETNNHHKIVGIALHKEFNREFTMDCKTSNSIGEILISIAKRENYGVEAIDYGYYGRFRWLVYDKTNYTWGVIVFLGVIQNCSNIVKCIIHTDWHTNGFEKQEISPGLQQILNEFSSQPNINECDNLTHYYYECPLFWSQRLFNPEITQNLTCFHPI